MSTAPIEKFGTIRHPGSFSPQNDFNSLIRSSVKPEVPITLTHHPKYTYITLNHKHYPQNPIFNCPYTDSKAISSQLLIILTLHNKPILLNATIHSKVSLNSDSKIYLLKALQANIILIPNFGMHGYILHSPKHYIPVKATELLPALTAMI